MGVTDTHYCKLNKDQVYSAGNCVQYLVTTSNGKKSEEEHTHTCNLITLLHTRNTLNIVHQLDFDFPKVKKNLKTKTVPRGRHALTNSLNHLLGRCTLQSLFILSVSRTYYHTLSNTVQPGACCCGDCSVTRSCPTLFNPMDCSTPGFPVLQHLLEFAQTHVH